MQGGVSQPMLLKDELAQALGFVFVALAQLISEEAILGFSLKRAAQRDSFIA